jgi:glucose/arabinose dehydrogenase
LNRVTPGADFGFPSCYGAQEPSLPDGQTCDGTEPPRATFPHQSTPGGIAFYSYDGFPWWEGDLVVALRGSWTLPEPAGYAVIMVGFEGAEPDGQTIRLVPASSLRVYAPFSLSDFSLFGRGLFPYHPADVVIDGQGWIYVAFEEGRILRFRPRPEAGSP